MKWTSVYSLHFILRSHGNNEEFLELCRKVKTMENCIIDWPHPQVCHIAIDQSNIRY